MLLALLLAACTPSDDLPEAELLVEDASRSEVVGKGLLLTITESTGGPSYPVLLDSDGRVRWRRESSDRVLRVRAPRTGEGVLLLLDQQGATPGRVQRETFDGRLLSVTEATDAHHDVLELADGRIAWLEHVEGVTSLPKDPDAPISTDAVMAAFEGGKGEPLFHFLEDYPRDPFWTCDHMRLGQRIPGHYQWTHSNSLVQAPGRDGELGVLSRNLDGLVWFDLDSGAFLEQLGGEEGTFDVGSEQLDHPHMSHAPSSDTVLVFDNRLHSREDSRVVEWAMDRDAGTAEIVWSYTHPEIGNVGFLGDARRLPGGNTLISWTDERRLTEVTPEGDIVWELLVDNIKYVGRVELWEGKLP